MRQLSTPVASRAESKCSTVRIVYPSLDSVVHRGVSFTAWSIDARTIFDLKTKYRPVRADSGTILTVESLPEWSAGPVLSIQLATVCCNLPVCNYRYRFTCRFVKKWTLVEKERSGKRVQISRRWGRRTWVNWKRLRRLSFSESLGGSRTAKEEYLRTFQQRKH